MSHLDSEDPTPVSKPHLHPDYRECWWTEPQDIYDAFVSVGGTGHYADGGSQPSQKRHKTAHFPAVSHTPDPPPMAQCKGYGRKIIEICTLTMRLTTRARNRGWHGLDPITLETGFDLLTESGRQKAFRHLVNVDPDVIVGEWMCDPFSQMQNINRCKSRILALKLRVLSLIHI